MYVLLAVFGSNHSNNKSGNTCGEDDSFGSPLSIYFFLFNLPGPLEDTLTFFVLFFAVLAEALKLAAVGAP